MSGTDPVLLERRDDGVAAVRLNRPDKRNALDTATLARLLEHLTELAEDPALRVLVVSTTDPTALCAGADIGERLDAAGGLARMTLFTRLYSALDAFPVPVIAVCVGNCVGAGAEIAAAADLRIGGDNLKLAWAGARLGVPVGPARLAPLIGLARAKELIYTGRTVTAGEAETLGLLSARVLVDEAEPAAFALAATIAGQDPAGVRALKAMFRDLDGLTARVEHENAALLHFQQHGGGLPRGK